MKEIHFGRPMIEDEEKEAVLSVLNSPQLVHGPKAKDFEFDFASSLIGAKGYATTVSSCTAGLHLAYMHLGIGVGDEVIVPSQSHVATAHSVEITGAKPVFVDCELNSGNIDVNSIEIKISNRTKVISVVHYLGLPVDMNKVMELAKKYKLFVVEDCALAVGSSYEGVSCGLIGDVGSFSFYPVKHITTAEGGMVISKHEDVIKSIENIKAFGYDRIPSERKIPGVYDVARLGLNFRMNEIAASIGVEQIKKAKVFQEQRNKNSKELRKALSTIDEIFLLEDGSAQKVHSNYCLVIVFRDSNLAKKRPEIINSMKAQGVGTSVYYPVPLPLTKYYREKYGYQDKDFPNSSKISHESIALPVGPHLKEEDMQIIANALVKAIEENK